jgi:outer membrane protein OmpA-like peptidoglycan-associated protein
MKNSKLRPRLLPACLMMAAAIGLAGCETMNTAGMSPTQRNAAIGAGVGAVAGAAIGRDVRGAAVGAGVGALGGYVWSQQMEQRKRAMEQATVGTGVAVTQTADNQLKLEIPSDISFDVGRADIRPNFRSVLDQFASGLQNQPNTDVRIIGHTDSTGSDELNDRLSIQRAQSTRDYLTARGVNPQQVAITGRGEREPIADNSTEAGRAKNRRVEIFLGERANVAAR